ncbi:uncharacterized protein ASCRUDRAFT_76618 [Ascoidea rubescens DSM 1968]|uniref:Uncharacterized protein n=1 Tax=Ascoidea rubescens DSM 1968 TaxID=1344418 RepID=A0A1D2VEP7_9ASCO|nr:hypothetical protein ASCRUDRAFT_76618 [Ascoidea rubescens DSM 1968]ODV60106.1 hypothetical protein ASCRUDRAFT_76618 [Ascoidea rubescens DSM 1968]
MYPRLCVRSEQNQHSCGCFSSKIPQGHVKSYYVWCIIANFFISENWDAEFSGVWR